MAVTNEKSSQQTDVTAVPSRQIDVNEWGGKVRAYRFDFTQGAAAGDIGSTGDLVTLPARSRVLGFISHYRNSDFGAARTIDIGTRAHKNSETGVAIAANATRYVSAAVATPAGRASFAADGQMAGDHDKLLGEAVVFFTVAGSTIPAGATLQGEIMVAVE